MPKLDSEIIYKTKLSSFNLIIMIVGFLFFIVFGSKIYIETQFPLINWFIVLPITLIAFGVFIFIEILFIKVVIITKKELIFYYPILFRNKKIKWKLITDAKMNFVNISSGSIHKYGKEIQLFSNKKKYSFVSFNRKESDQLVFYMGKQLGSKLRAKMKKGYKESEKKYWKEERKYRKWLFKYVVPVLVLLFIVIYLIEIIIG